MMENENDPVLTKYVKLIVQDNRELIGKVICYDCHGNLILSDASESVPANSHLEATDPSCEEPINRKRFLTTCMVPYDAIKQMEIVDDPQ
ncbi:Ribonucleoprotein LSM domain eukaryotic/archaea-type [Perkinsela sp. CCAP 1560/4]|nr:Ribonucleoprotein LSM domain eukaryotic/archaea-type [Perkinsela sp. CCAP 1560/4]|eukprot:KNH09501.1 Ribonucleoprotein LSM domain eukaryotic/archaea-type [Perkinsela sp. CCAP 1560/4]